MHYKSRTLTWLNELEGFSRVLFVDGVYLSSELSLQSFEHIEKHVSYHGQHLVIVFFEGHLNVQAYKLAEMSVSVTIFSSEHSPHLGQLVN